MRNLVERFDKEMNQTIEDLSERILKGQYKNYELYMTAVSELHAYKRSIETLHDILSNILGEDEKDDN